jgi:diacylglycerol kinase family enzyme
MLSLLLLAAAVAIAIVGAIRDFPTGLTILVAGAAAVAIGWFALMNSGPARIVGFVVAGAFAIAVPVLVIVEGALLRDLVVVVLYLLALAAGRRAFSFRADLASAARPERAVLFFNPKSGGGKAERFKLADEARKRGIEARELHPGEDLTELVEAAIRDGADGLAMAGGDGSQAIVAAAAAAHGLPYACIPAGTRNHFALDLGVLRDDVVGALDAFVDGRERVVDLAEVNGRVFVNNVSLGVYAEAVQEEGYREAKLRTLLATAPRVLATDAGPTSFRWMDPDGGEHSAAAVLMVSNGAYRLGRALGSGTRPRLDAGELGIAAADVAGGRMHEWTAPEFQVDADAPVPAGIDGESLRLDPPVLFKTRPAALRVRIAPHHPGGSPSATIPATAPAALRKLAEYALKG